MAAFAGRAKTEKIHNFATIRVKSGNDGLSTLDFNFLSNGVDLLKFVKLVF